MAGSFNLTSDVLRLLLPQFVHVMEADVFERRVTGNSIVR